GGRGGGGRGGGGGGSRRRGACASPGGLRGVSVVPGRRRSSFHTVAAWRRMANGTLIATAAARPPAHEEPRVHRGVRAPVLARQYRGDGAPPASRAGEPPHGQKPARSPVGRGARFGHRPRPQPRRPRSPRPPATRP